MQRGEDHVPGLGRLAGDFRRLLIADLADVDHVGVLPQDAAQLRGESLACLGIDLDLGDVVDVVLDGVLDGDDVLLVAVDLAKAGIERGAFARTSRAADNKQAVRLGDQGADLLAHLFAHAEAFQIGDLPFLVKDAHDELFAGHASGRGDAEIDGATVHFCGKAAVLRLPLLGDIAPRRPSPG